MSALNQAQPRRRRRRLSVLAALVAGLVCALAWSWIKWPREPSYQGRPLTRWLRDLSYADSGREAKATAAVQQMGTNALPTLVTMLQPRRGPAITTAVHLLNRWFGLEVLTDSDRRLRAMRAFVALGGRARPAIPALAALLADARADARSVAFCLLQAGPESIPSLVLALRFPHARYHAALQLGSFGSNAAAALPSLVLCLRVQDAAVRVATVQSLGAIAGARVTEMPEFLACLDDPEPVVRREVLRALGDLGLAAQVCSPGLVHALEDVAGDVRAEARRALFKVDPEAARKAGLAQPEEPWSVMGQD